MNSAKLAKLLVAISAISFIWIGSIAADQPRPDSIAALKEANRVLTLSNKALTLSNETLLRSNDALQQAMPARETRDALDDAKAAAERAARASEVNRRMIEMAKKDLVTLMRDQTNSLILWNVAIWITIVSVALFLVFSDHRRVQGQQSKEFSELIKAVQNGRIENFNETTKASAERSQLAASLEQNTVANKEQIDLSNHVNEKISLGKAEVEKKIDKIEVTTDASHTILEEMKKGV